MALTPTKEKDSNIVKITAYLYRSTLSQLEALAKQRGREKDTELQRQAMHIGSVFLALSGEPDPVTGRYGHLSSEQLAQQARHWVVSALDWMEHHGHPLHTSSSEAAITRFVEHLHTDLPSHAPSPPPAQVPLSVQVGEPQVTPFFMPATTSQALNLDESEVI